MSSRRTCRRRCARVVDTVTDKGPGGHILTGPVYVEGAEPGDALEVRILSIDLSIPYGYNGCSGFLKENCRPNKTKIIPLDREEDDRDVRAGHRHSAPSVLRQHGRRAAARRRARQQQAAGHARRQSRQPRARGRDDAASFPVHVAGALFEVGDGHAAQGDGEVDQTAIETSLRGRLQLTVHKGMTLAWPRAETPTDYISMGTDEDLTKATKIAIQEMVDFLVATRKDSTSSPPTSSRASPATSPSRSSWTGRSGVHVKMPKGIFQVSGSDPGRPGSAHS